jgi:hypothetical protein
VSDLWDDYLLWHRAQVDTKDIDPVYPWLKDIADQLGLDYYQRGWLVMCHVIWYHPGSTLAGWTLAPHHRFTDFPGLLELPTGTERRAHRDWRATEKHLAWLRENLPPRGILQYVEERLGAGPWGWRELNDVLTEPFGNGRWAAYKTAEMLIEVAGAPSRVTDAGHAHSSGPRKGLADLYGGDVEGHSPEAVRVLDNRTIEVATWLVEPDIGKVETSLCDFHSALGGRYYVGHDIDGMQADLLSERTQRFTDPRLLDLAWSSRERVFARSLLGERSGWTGVRKPLKTAYRDRRELVGVKGA